MNLWNRSRFFASVVKTETRRLGSWTGQRVEQHLVHEGEDRGVRAHPEAEGGHGGQGEDRALHEEARGVAEVLAEAAQETSAGLGRDPRPRAGRVGGASRAAGSPPRRSRSPARG